MALAKHGSWFGWIAVGMLALAPADASAQGFVDLYLGVGLRNQNNVDVDPDNFDPTLTGMLDGKIGNDVTPSLGLRGGYWFEQDALRFLGIALDASLYGASGEVRCVAPLCPVPGVDTNLDIVVTPLTPLLMLRLPLDASEEIPGGRFQPYAAVGPAFAVSFASSDFGDLGPNVGLHDDFQAATFDVGLDARGGLAIQLTRHFALFGEYRYTYVKAKFEDEVDDAFAFDGETDINLDAKLKTHHLLFGGSFRF